MSRAQRAPREGAVLFAKSPRHVLNFTFTYSLQTYVNRLCACNVYLSRRTER
jgi:hypothetical protein